MIEALIRGLFLLTFAQNAIAIPKALSPAQQRPLTPASPQYDTISMLTSERQLVPGDKSRSVLLPVNTRRATLPYQRIDRGPNPIPMNHRFFGYLNGYLPDQPIPSLEHAILKLNIKKDDEEPREYIGEISHWSQIILRQYGLYSHELLPGENEILADYFFLTFFTPAGWYTFTGELSLPDGRLLFCIEATMYLAGTG